MAGDRTRSIEKDYFKVPFFTLRLCGISIRPIENTIIGILYRIYCILTFVIVYLYFPVAEILYVVYNPDLENFTSGITYICSHTLGTLKIILILIFRKKIDGFCKQIEIKPCLPDRNRSGNIEFHHIQSAVTACNYQGYIFYMLVIAVVLPKIFYSLRDSGDETVFDVYANATTIIKRKRDGPFNCVVPFNSVDSPYFEIAAIYQAFCATVLGCIIGTIDAIICGIMCHLKAQLLILKNSLQTYIERGIFLMKEDNTNDEVAASTIKTLKEENNPVQVEKLAPILRKYVHIAVNEIIEHHQKVIELSEDAEETFSLLMLVQFLFSLSIICCQLFQLSILAMGSARFYSMGLYAILMLFQIFLFCYRGNEVMLHSHDIIDSVFMSNWVEIDTKTQKSLLLMMTRACKPIRLTAGKFVFLSLEAFMSIIRGSGSYFMVLRSFNMPQEYPSNH